MQVCILLQTYTISSQTHTNTHTQPFNGPFSGTTRVSRYQKGKTNLDLLKQKTVSGSDISWAICKSAPRSRLKARAMTCWCGYLSGVRYRLFAYGPADATAISKPRHLLPHLNPDWFYQCTKSFKNQNNRHTSYLRLIASMFCDKLSLVISICSCVTQNNK